MDNAKSQLVDKLKSSTNILVTVSRNPTVDQLSACVGLTLLLNKLGKHATAVFSGEVPSTLEFLEPEQTLEKNTDSLRDFIIALDKTKADKLRYKVEDDMVRIFITPYRVSISDKDLEFSQGDFNVDVVIALGVFKQEDFDQAITAHGRILHDAVVGSITINGGVELGGINWSDSLASSLTEMVFTLAKPLGEDLIDQQVATALLTGIVSETARFSNEKTTPQTMSVSAELMAAGANQQLVATKLDEPVVEKTSNPTPVDDVAISQVPDTSENEAPKTPPVADGTLEINHDNIEAILQAADTNDTELPAPIDSAEQQPDQPLDRPAGFAVDDTQKQKPLPDSGSSLEANSPPRLIIDPPSLGGTLTANSQPEKLDPANDILGAATQPPPTLLSRRPIASQEPAAAEPTPALEPAFVAKPAVTKPKFEQSMAGFTPPPPAWVPSAPAQNTVYTAKTLSEIEDAVHNGDAGNLDSARDEVARALNSQSIPPEPVQALGAQPLGGPLHPTLDLAPLAPTAAVNLPVPPPEASAVPSDNDPTAPPPVPPPIQFTFGSPPPPAQ